MRRLAWHLQANAEGGLSERARQRAVLVAVDADLRIRAPQSFLKELSQGNRYPRLPAVGTCLNREFQGRNVSVEVLEKGFRTVHFRVPSANPPVKDRINCVNAKLRNHAGQSRLLIDPRCKHLIKDFEQVSWKSDPHGNTLADLNKSDPIRTHASDAIGYLIAREFPMREVRGERSGPLLIC